MLSGINATADITEVTNSVYIYDQSKTVSGSSRHFIRYGSISPQNAPIKTTAKDM